MIDTHAHIYLPEFNEDRSAVIERAKAAGVRHIILPNVDSTTINDLLTLEAGEPHFFHAAMGLHPTSVKKDFQQELNFIKQQLDSRLFCAIGEIGLDLFWDKTYITEQIVVFEKQLEWAINYNLPVIIHVREAFPEALKSVHKFNCQKLTGIFHSFSGTKEDAQDIINLGGFKLGINGVITFKNSGLDKILNAISLEHIVLETDAPYLSPVPFRGKRNEPQNLLYILEKLSTIYNESHEEIIKKTDQNTKQLFKID